MTVAGKGEQKQSSPVMQRMRGKAVLSVCCRDGVTVLDRLYQEGAAKLRFPQNDMARFEGVMINTSGGVTGGDYLEWDITLQHGAQATLTTQAAEKIYRAVDNTPARVNAHLTVGEKSRLCWLPQETILFNRSALQRSLNVSMAGDGELLIGEAIVFGRKLMGESLDHAFFQDNWLIRRDNAIIHADALRFGPDIHHDIAAPVCLNGGGAMASLLLVAPDPERFLEPARAIIGDAGGISAWNGKLLARIVCRDSYFLRQRLVALVSLLNGKAKVPKIWSI